MLCQRLFPVTARVLLVCLVTLAAACTDTNADSSSERETVVIHPQTSLISPLTEVTLSLEIRKDELAGITVDPEVATIFAKPSDRRLVTQVLWRVECRMDGKVVSCPEDFVRRTVITPKEGCSPELFGTEEFVIPGEHTAISSGEVQSEIAERLYEGYQKQQRAMLSQEAERGDYTDCDGKPMRAAPDSADPYQGFRWLYDVTVYLGSGRKVVEDPEIWVSKDKGG